MIDLRTLSLSDIARRLRTGQLSSRALVDLAISGHRAVGGELNAYKTWAPEQAQYHAAAADVAFQSGRSLGPLQGVPVSVKDLFGVSGMPCYAGTRRRLPRIWEREGEVVGRLRRQLAVIVGKTHTGEFALGGLGVNPHWGTPRNPWDVRRHRVPGGSSSGAGVSLWEQSALLALGTDTGGSVRVPASLTGCVGLKVTVGRWASDGIVPLTTMFDTPGLLARSVADALFGFAALDPVAGDPMTVRERARQLPLADVRIGVADSCLWEGCSPGVAETVEAALEELAGYGARLIGPVFSRARDALALLEAGGIAAAECNAFIEAELPAWRRLLGDNIAALIDEASALSLGELLARQRCYQCLVATGVDCFNHVDVIASPTVRMTPPLLEELEDLQTYRRCNSAVLNNTVVVNLLGLCAITLPVGLDREGMPVGLQLIARPGAEEHLLAVALAAERALGAADDRLGRPPLRGELTI